MARTPSLEVADIFHPHGDACVRTMPGIQPRPAQGDGGDRGLPHGSARRACRGCEDCAHARIAYNSLYGDFSVKSVVRVSASFSLSLSTAGT